MQPYYEFKPDGVILFSDILTPLTGMNIPFDIIKGKVYIEYFHFIPMFIFGKSVIAINN